MTEVQPAQNYPQAKLEVSEANVHRRGQRPLESHFQREGQVAQHGLGAQLSPEGHPWYVHPQSRALQLQL